MAGKVGYQMVLTVGGTESSRCKDATLNANGDEVDVSTRAGAGWREFVQGLKDWGVDAEHLWVPTDVQLLALRTAWLNGTVVALTLLDDDGYGYSGNAIVSNFGRTEPLDGAVMVPITLKGTGPLAVVTPES